MKLILDGMSFEQAVALALWYVRFGEQVADERFSRNMEFVLL